MRKQSRYTNRIVVKTGTYTWTVTLTDHVRQHTFHLPNSVGVGRNATNATPNWFVNALRDMRDVTKFPYLHEAMPMLLELMRSAALDPSNLSRNRQWADIELRLYRVAKFAREGFHDDSLAVTYEVLPEDSGDLPSRVPTATIVRGLDNVDFDFDPDSVCSSCWLVKPCEC